MSDGFLGLPVLGTVARRTSGTRTRPHLSAEERQAVADGLLIQPLIGSLPNIMAPEWFDGLKRAAEGRRLMVLDTLRRFHIEEENASGPMAQVIGRMEAIAADTGCSIVFLHHASKGAAIMGSPLHRGVD